MRGCRDQWVGWLALIVASVTYCELRSVKRAVTRLDKIPSAPIELMIESEVSSAPKLSTDNMAKQSYQTGMSASKNAHATKTKKDSYVWPKPKDEWKLVPDSTADESALPGEGIVSAKIAAISRVGRGVLFNAIHRDPLAKRGSKNIAAAMKGASRMRAALAEAGESSELKFALVTEKAPFLFMMDSALCKPMWPECNNFSDTIKVFDKVLFYEDFDQPAIVERRERFQTWPELWLKRIMASLNSPFAQTMVVDSDVYACSKFESMFDTFLGDSADIAVTLAPAPFGASRNYPGAFRPGFGEEYAKYTERNCGLQLLATASPKVQQLLALFRDVYVRQANDTTSVSIGNDQCAFREAMWTMKRTAGLREATIPAEAGCRHDTGCADGCYVVHRHLNPEMSRAELQEYRKKKRDEKKAKEAAKEMEALERAAAKKDLGTDSQDDDDEVSKGANSKIIVNLQSQSHNTSAPFEASAHS